MGVQFGLALNRFGGFGASAPLTSDTTSGPSGSIRQADELSMTVTPAAANFGASSFDVEPPAENSAMSRPLGSAVAASSMRTSTPSHGRVLPAERDEAKNRISSIGKARSARMRRIIAPTCPVAPTIPTLAIIGSPLDRSSRGWSPSSTSVHHSLLLVGAEFE